MPDAPIPDMSASAFVRHALKRSALVLFSIGIVASLTALTALAFREFGSSFRYVLYGVVALLFAAMFLMMWHSVWLEDRQTDERERQFCMESAKGRFGVLVGMRDCRPWLNAMREVAHPAMIEQIDEAIRRRESAHE